MTTETLQTKQASPTKSSTPWTLTCLSLFMLLPSLGTSIANISLPTLTHAFGAPVQQVQWVVISFLLATTTLVVSAGRLGDVVGRRRLLMAGAALFTAASAVCAAAPSLWVLIAARAVQGIGAAAMLALTVAFVGQAVPKERTGSAMGMLGTMSAVGTALGPSLGGVLIASFGWQAIFLINIPLGFVAIAMARRFLPPDAAQVKSARFDNLGTITLAATLAAYALSMTLGKGNFGPLNIALLVAAVAGVGAFMAVESRTDSPLVHLAMFRDRRLTASLIMSALVSTVLMATLVVGPFYLSQGLLLSTGAVGLVMSVGPAVAAFTGAPAGRLVDRFRSQVTSMGGLIGMALGCGSLVAIPASFGVAGYLVPIVIITGSYAVFQAANNTGVMADVPQDRRGVISGLLTLSRNLGLITGASAMGAVFAATAGSSNGGRVAPAAIDFGMRTTFAIATALIVVSLAVAVWGRRGSVSSSKKAA
ncbi:MFS transporter [Hydrogenophaga sp. BPS33]|uniref:MFS transporter n=1 Tax=Hydrogenophaga sp. BPS33 TaxID=2651974 RepID=UPI00131F8654|nr:MFS transporter [Hydrogenophaga sp. BPS33]QHE84658.1 MFS transporter [Hydrogenophaga sp. BPS33]